MPEQYHSHKSQEIKKKNKQIKSAKKRSTYSKASILKNIKVFIKRVLIHHHRPSQKEENKRLMNLQDSFRNLAD